MIKKCNIKTCFTSFPAICLKQLTLWWYNHLRHDLDIQPLKTWQQWELIMIMRWVSNISSQLSKLEWVQWTVQYTVYCKEDSKGNRQNIPNKHLLMTAELICRIAKEVTIWNMCEINQPWQNIRAPMGYSWERIRLPIYGEYVRYGDIQLWRQYIVTGASVAGA